MAEQLAQAEITAQINPQELMLLQQTPEGLQKLQNDIAGRAAQLIGELTEQYSQAIAPPQQTDPLVAIRQQELALRGADIQRKAQEFEERQQLEREKEYQDSLLDVERLKLSKDALENKTRIAEERIDNQRDIAALREASRGR